MNISVEWARRLLAGLAVAAMLALPSVANAVTKSTQILSADGKPLPGTAVTIKFPDGTEQEKESDKDGVVFWDANQDGDYLLTWDGGKQTVSVTGAAGGGGISATALGVGAAVLAGGIILASDDDDDNGGGSPGGGFSVSYTISYSVTDNPGGHPDNFSGALCTIEGDNPGSINLDCQNTGLNMNINGSTSGGTFTASGSCTYQGFATTCSASGSLDPDVDVFDGTMSAGPTGLPGNQAITGTFDNDAP